MDVTISVLLFRGFSGEEAFRISFLMSIPATFAAAVGITAVEGATPLGLSFLVTVVASFLSALFSMGLFLRVARRVRFWSLCVALGVLALLPLTLYLL